MVPGKKLPLLAYPALPGLAFAKEQYYCVGGIDLYQDCTRMEVGIPVVNMGISNSCSRNLDKKSRYSCSRTIL